ncbi:OLC1v1015630C2 [Oldenlandia corymbosa var. corymbosa]|uniref:OLC1v1015630C2 n=1 Tax=Oldenlandia corymbosa var. corymbosa TaxID=529605 RepID=A0AAV1E462_OLDCO|nr:OLC1v1015630C2 [Oldenlandia corymbosa var. corymbosa]
MDKSKSKSKSKSVIEEPQGSTLQERKQHAEKEQQAVEKEVEELLTWTDMVEGMDESQLKNYVKNRPKHLKTAKREKIGKSRRVNE